MSLSVEIQRLNHVVVLQLSGRLSVLEPSLREQAWELIEKGSRYFVIDLRNVSYLDNSGLGQLCWIYTIVRNRGGEMVLLKPTSRIKALLNVTKLDTVMRSFERDADAIASMENLISAVSA